MKLNILIALLLLPTFCMADEIKFSNEQIKVNVVKFIKTVFGTKAPTLADRLYFQGGVESLELDEIQLIYKICSRELKISNPENSSECFDKVVTPRLDKPELFESLYYKLLRQKLAMKAEDLEVVSIDFIEGIKGKTAGYFQVTVNDEGLNRHPSDYIRARKQLLLRHVASPIDVPESGTVSVQSVIIPIHRYLGDK